jgi:iron complex transport system ATP-binding protein
MIKIEALHVKLSGKPILEGYSLSVEKRGVLAILGANGVGKSTLLNTLIGLRKPASGRIRVDGRIGFVPQLFHAAFAYTVIDIVLMGRARQIGLFGSPSAADYRIARKYLAMMDVADLEHRPFNELSGGQRQLVMIGQALASECEILILDEPCSSLDYKNQSIVIEILRTLNVAMGLTIVFTTHAPQHGLEIATDILLMKDRKSYRHGRASDILTAENLTELYGVPIERAEFTDGGKYTFAPRYGGAAGAQA